MNSRELIRRIPQLAGKRILVIGDLILDEYLTGRAMRMSREAPIPVLEYESRRLIPGGAANPAANIAALGAEAIQIGVIGADEYGQQLRDELELRGIDAAGLVTDAERATTVKTRIMAQMGLRFPQQVARLDRIDRSPLSKVISAEVQARIIHTLSSVDAVLCSDYQAGFLEPDLVNAIRSGANTLLTADAQGELNKYAGFGLVKCNAAEAAEHLRADLVTDADFTEAARELYASLQLTGAMVITRGAEGATLATADGSTAHCPAPAVTDVFDTVGAGDTAIAMTTLALAAGASYAEAVTLANYASGLVVRRVGNHAPTAAELTAALEKWSSSS